MTDFEDKLSYEELLAENSILTNKCDALTNHTNILEEKLRTLRDKQCYEICEYFNECNSLKQTADYFLYEDIEECGYALIEFNGCSDSIKDATDYNEFRILAYDEDENEDNNENEHEDENEDNKE